MPMNQAKMEGLETLLPKIRENSSILVVQLKYIPEIIQALINKEELL